MSEIFPEKTQGLARAILDTELGPNDAGAKTVREYLVKLLSLVWDEEQGFNGKRPFGNSGWQGEVYTALVKNALVPGRLGADGYLDYVDMRVAPALVLDAIASLGADPEPRELPACAWYNCQQHHKEHERRSGGGVKCHLAEYQEMTPVELAGELTRLRTEIGQRTLVVHDIATGKRREAARLEQAAHDYLDVQHVLRHLDKNVTESRSLREEGPGNERGT